METTAPALSNPIQVLNILLADPLERLVRTQGDGAASWCLLRDGRFVLPDTACKLRGPSAVEFYSGRLFAIGGEDGPADAPVVYAWFTKP
ncbi:hypothetical protein TSH58p_03760 [Azospirillum sp. TSH58]|uniref:hypothetical protein n=1 Tax=Azospirillum sp. TSH58 TaxID=664962 RepID=UPI000D600B16|nr:hypothetical protein [Azospirillum sp. TSH58]AWJ82710.1 hypothetical protein TSH58p_03760 [Azospirillum sp. TSH58]PWC58009.1 hypothetical protein TSH58_30825 [Azospirillum sp. TSH58]